MSVLHTNFEDLFLKNFMMLSKVQRIKKLHDLQVQRVFPEPEL